MVLAPGPQEATDRTNDKLEEATSESQRCPFLANISPRRQRGQDQEFQLADCPRKFHAHVGSICETRSKSAGRESLEPWRMTERHLGVAWVGCGRRDTFEPAPLHPDTFSLTHVKKGSLTTFLQDGFPDDPPWFGHTFPSLGDGVTTQPTPSFSRVNAPSPAEQMTVYYIPNLWQLGTRGHGSHDVVGGYPTRHWPCPVIQ